MTLPGQASLPFDDGDDYEPPTRSPLPCMRPRKTVVQGDEESVGGLQLCERAMRACLGIAPVHAQAGRIPRIRASLLVVPVPTRLEPGKGPHFAKMSARDAQLGNGCRTTVG